MKASIITSLKNMNRFHILSPEKKKQHNFQRYIRKFELAVEFVTLTPLNISALLHASRVYNSFNFQTTDIWLDYIWTDFNTGMNYIVAERLCDDHDSPLYFCVVGQHKT